MRSLKHVVIVITLTTVKRILGIEVAPDSNCSSLCIDQLGADESSPYTSTTIGSMLVCNDWELTGPNTTATGEKWRSCLGCESMSAYYDPVSKENDVYWFLRKPYHCLRKTSFVRENCASDKMIDNMKSTIDWCILGSLGLERNPTATAAMLTCGTICQGLNASLTSNLLDGNMNLQYQYCSFDNDAFSQNIGTCTKCISTLPAAKTLINCKLEQKLELRQRSLSSDGIC